MATYPELLELSKQRFADASRLRGVEVLDKFVLEDIVRYNSALSGVRQRISKRYEYDFVDEAERFLKSRNIHVGRRALIGVGYFDGESRERALPMIGHKDNIGEYHSTIWRDYFNMMDNFVAAEYPDSYEGVAYRQDDQLVLAVNGRRDIAASRTETIAELSRAMPTTVITLSQAGLIHDIFRNGDVQHLEIDAPLADID